MQPLEKAVGLPCLKDILRNYPNFTTRDIQALSALNIPHSLDEIGLGDALRHTLLKLLASMGHEPESDNHWIRQRFLMDHNAPQKPSQHKSILPILQKAVWEDRYILCRLQFFSHAGYSDPVRIAPFTLITSEQRWYIIGAQRDFIRVYPINMLLDISLLNEVFTRPLDYTPEPIWNPSGVRPNNPCLRDIKLPHGSRMIFWIGSHG